MGIRYLTFKADVVGLNDLVSVYDLGKCTITISDIAGATTQLNTATKERVITELALMCENYEHWTAPISVNSSLSYSSDYLDLLQSVLP